MNANQIAEELENINWIQGDGTAKPFKHYADFVRKQAEEIEYWKSAFERAMTLYDQVKHLETQVYGGTTK